MLNTSVLLLFTVYRKPEYNAEACLYMESMLTCLHQLSSVKHTVLIAGDLNLPHVDWKFMHTTATDEIHVNFLAFASEFGLTQCVTESTRVDNILDIILVNDPHVVAECNMLAPVGSSDHDSVLFKLFMPDNDSNDEYVPNGNFALVYDYDNTDYDSLNLYLNSICWSEIFSCIYSPNECWNVFISILNYGISIYTPMRRASMSHRCAKKYPLYIRQLLWKKICCLATV